MDIVERLRKHVNDRGGASLENGAWSMMLKGADEIERLREALQKIKKRNPFHNQCPPTWDIQYYAQIITEMVGIANAALKEDE